ncbi:MAG TPA: hypothetical protein VFW35_10670 [Sphingomicrobium sp.]|nr:hypothetical protein [Sphingomicrobium sp.]
MNDAVTPVQEPPHDEGVRHHPVGGWRYILVELGIVTAGLFVALMLNSAVEWAHHKQLVREAQRNLGREITRNHRKIRTDLGYLRAALAQVNTNIATLQQIRAGRFRHGSLTNVMTFEQLDEAAWLTARNTGALSYMPYDDAQRYSDLYATVEYANGRGAAVMETNFQALAPALMGYDLSKIPAGEVTAMLRGDAQTKIGIETLEQLLTELDADLVKNAREQKRSKSK